jgi:hypothetical protein
MGKIKFELEVVRNPGNLYTIKSEIKEFDAICKTISAHYSLSARNAKVFLEKEFLNKIFNNWMKS